MDSKIIEIEVKNWSKYQRKDVQKMSFFRVEADIFEDQKFFSLKHLDKVLLLYIYTRCCKQASGKVSINTRQASAMTSIRHDHVLLSIFRLQQNQLLTAKDVTCTSPREEKRRGEEKKSTHKKIEQKKSNVPDRVNPIDFELEKLYEKYPRKEGKKRAFQILRRKLDSKKKMLQFEQALSNYIAILEAQKTERQYIKQFSTFANNFEDYINPDPMLFQSEHNVNLDKFFND